MCIEYNTYIYTYIYVLNTIQIADTNVLIGIYIRYERIFYLKY